MKRRLPVVSIAATARLILVLKAQITVNQQRVDVGVLPHRVAAYPGIDLGEGEKEKPEEVSLVFSRGTPSRGQSH